MAKMSRKLVQSEQANNESGRQHCPPCKLTFHLVSSFGNGHHFLISSVARASFMLPLRIGADR
jgi:hypothetical protein